MAHCTKCGAAVADNAGFCAACGAPQSAASAPQGGAVATQSQMAENVAGLLCYLFWWVTGLIFFFIDKRPAVQFHAKQSIVVFGGLTIIRFVLGMFIGASFFAVGFAGLGAFGLLMGLLWLLGVVLWIVLMIKASQGEQFRVPIAADLADKIFGKS